MSRFRNVSTLSLAIGLVAAIPARAGAQKCDPEVLHGFAIGGLLGISVEQLAGRAARAVAHACPGMSEADALMAVSLQAPEPPDKFQADADRFLKVAISGPLAAKACPGIETALAAAKARPWRERRNLLFDACHLERFDFVAREQFAESFGPLGESWSVLGALMFAWMVDHGADKESARKIARAVASVPDSTTMIGKLELPSSSTPLALDGPIVALQIGPGELFLDGAKLGKAAFDLRRNDAVAELGSALAKKAHPRRELAIFIDRRLPYSTLHGAVRAAAPAKFGALGLVAHRKDKNFSRGIVDVGLADEGPQTERLSPRLTVFLEEKGVVISGTGGVLPGEKEGAPTIAKAASGDYDLAALAAKVVELGKVFPGEEIRVGAQENVSVEEVFRAIDACHDASFKRVVLTTTPRATVFAQH
jgi:biopolymer transport protein ExbD